MRISRQFPCQNKSNKQKSLLLTLPISSQRSPLITIHKYSEKKCVHTNFKLILYTRSMFLCYDIRDEVIVFFSCVLRHILHHIQIYILFLFFSCNKVLKNNTRALKYESLVVMETVSCLDCQYFMSLSIVCLKMMFHHSSCHHVPVFEPFFQYRFPVWKV